MRVEVLQCVCGFEVRAMASRGYAVARLDREAWGRQCLERDRTREPMVCHRFLKARKEQRGSAAV